MARKYAAIDPCGKLRLAEDHAGARSAQGLMRGRRDDVGVGHGRRMRPTGDESRKVGHINQKIGTHFIGDPAHPDEVKLPRIRTSAGNDHLRAFERGLLLQFVIVDGLGILADLVAGDLIQLTGEAELVAVRQMTAIGARSSPITVSPGSRQRHRPQCSLKNPSAVAR